MPAKQSFYALVVGITEDYLGPATPRFLNRISLNHLDKPATRLVKTDLPELITWVRLAASMMTDDLPSIEQYISRLRNLLDPSSTSKADGHTNRPAKLAK